jgi:hypothetical protein
MKKMELLGSNLDGFAIGWTGILIGIARIYTEAKAESSRSEK